MLQQSTDSGQLKALYASLVNYNSSNLLPPLSSNHRWSIPSGPPGSPRSSWVGEAEAQARASPQEDEGRSAGPGAGRRRQGREAEARRY